MSELSQITGLPVRRLRDYVFRDLIQPLERRGTATRYSRSQLVRVIAIKRMRGESGLELAEIKRRMDAMGERELEAWIMTAPLPDAVARALGSSDTEGGRTGTSGDAASVASSNATANGAGGLGVGALAANRALDAWYHVELLPGLVLQISATASPAVRNAAKRICDEYVGG